MYDPRYIKGLEHFNKHEFFECHEEIESVWLETGGPQKDFYKGMIQAAVALYHFEHGSVWAAKSMYLSCVKYLEPYRPSYLGVDLDQLLPQLSQCMRPLLDAPEGAEVKCDPQRLPTIEIPI